ncbi:helix-turn-helix domain-containing protein [Georgenia halophila]|uniref:Helix-turn-helix domain-containing protein n=1 Tax=Georgenia halophila TaxID=620889 RepID=A0ABP8LNF0_9MICO
MLDDAPSIALPRTDAPTDVVEDLDSALWVRRGDPPTMERPHRHDDLEINVVLRGRLDYLFGGSRVSVHAGQIAMFWAATPHRLIEPRSGDVCWVHIPLSTVLSWSLPDHDVCTLLRMAPVIVPVDAVPGDAEALFESWRHELTGDHTEIALLEAQAFVRRALKHHRESATAGPGEAAAVEAPRREPEAEGHDVERATGVRHVAVMAQYMAAHFRDPIAPFDVARAAHLAPTYAMGLFRQTVGITLGGYLTRCRVAEAQRLLITTSRTTGEVAHEAGFASQSSFYEHFRRTCGCSPGAYRKRLR